MKLISLAAAFVLVVSACSGDSSNPVVEPAVEATAVSQTPASIEPTPSRTPVAETTPTPVAEPVIEATPTASSEPTAAATPVPEAEPTPSIEATPVVEPSPEPTELGLPDFGTPQATEEATPEVEVTAEPTAVVVTTPESTPEATVEPTPVVTPEPTPGVTPEPTPIAVRLLSVDEILEEDSRLVNWVQPYTPTTGGDEEAELRACIELGDAVQILDNYGGSDATLALCSTAYRWATVGIDFLFVDPSCVHEQIRAYLLRPFDPADLIGWADVCYSEIDPNPHSSWLERCRTITGMVSPPVGNLPPDILLEHICMTPSADEIERWGRCTELIALYVAGMRARAMANQPEHQWPVLLYLPHRPEDMRDRC